MGVTEAGGQVDAYVDTLDDLVAALEQDPVNVQQLRGNGHTAEIDAALTEIVESSDIPIYVALVGELPELSADRPAEDLAVRLQSNLEPDALYIVAVGRTGGTTFSYGGDDVGVESAIYEGLQKTYGDYDYDAPRASDAGRAAMIATVASSDDGTISDSLVETYTEDATWTSPRYESRQDAYLHSEVAGLSLCVGVLVALTLWRLTRTWALRAVVPAPAPGAHGRATGRDSLPTGRTRQEVDAAARALASDAMPDVEDVRGQASSTLDKLAAELTRKPSGPGVDDALGCRVAAEQVVDSDDVLDVVGALVLARAGRELLQDPDRPYRPCFLNPLHGRGYVETSAPVGGDDEVTVPVCRRCSKAGGTARGYEPLLARRRGLVSRAPRPYYEGDTVWARTGFGSLDPDLWRRVTEDRS
ncbi:hypothetical protein [Nocardioides lijunqiniae]|uniref:hypothetical protein n=1 Tax=Nocardioides lijunqiniae TaxID=2760832 RepID=UPI001878D44E|nr:hypothetical protein [Nocardioides lijunqiniae]